MQTLNKEQLRFNYDALFYSKVQNLVEIRKTLRISQSMVAFRCGVSLRTIQNFENYKCKDAYLLFAYKQILKQ